MKDRRDETGGRWLLIKAQEPQAPISAELDDTSAKSGRSMREIAEANDAQWQSNRPGERRRSRASRGRRLKKVEPAFVEPMRCLPVETLPRDEAWSYEMKFDGCRAMAVKAQGGVTLYTQDKKSLNERFPALVQALEALPGEFVLDGEVVALDAQGRPSSRLLRGGRRTARPVLLYAFDLPVRDGGTCKS